MSRKKISSGVVHEVPTDLEKALTSDPQARHFHLDFFDQGMPSPTTDLRALLTKSVNSLNPEVQQPPIS